MRKKLLYSLIGVYLIFWAGGIGTHITGNGPPPHMAWAAPFFLALAAAIALAAQPGNARGLFFAAGIGFVSEILGVHTGYPFGPYSYTPVLQPLIAGVPIVVAGAWLVVFAYVQQLRLNVIFSAAAMTALDLVIDPLAANTLAYWHWRDGGPYYGVPLINFAGWFAVSLLIFAVAKPSGSNPVTVWLGTSILLFFSAIAGLHGFFFVSALGVSIASLGYFRSRSSSVSTMI